MTRLHPTDTSRKCSACHEIKPIEDFPNPKHLTCEDCYITGKKNHYYKGPSRRHAKTTRTLRERKYYAEEPYQ